MFVLKKNGSEMFVAIPGMTKSYTSRLQHARIFSSQEAAEAEACGNESALPLMSAFSFGNGR